MSDLKRFQRKPVEVNVELTDGKKEIILVHPLRMKNLELINKLSDKTTADQATKDVLIMVLEANGYNISQEEFADVDFYYVNKIMEGVMEVNGINEGDVKSKFLDDIKKKQQGSVIDKLTPK